LYFCVTIAVPVRLLCTAGFALPTAVLRTFGVVRIPSQQRTRALATHKKQWYSLEHSHTAVSADFVQHAISI
jgi:hypothetical protein